MILALVGGSSHAQTRISWPDKSGPTRDGHAAADDARGVPTHWNEATGQNIAWKVPLEGEGHSTPVIAGDRLWLTMASSDGKQMSVFLLDTRSGKVLRSRLLFENPVPEPLGNAVNTYASPSPVLEPGALYVHFGTYGTARLDPDTLETVWQRRDLPCRHFRGPGSSPVIAENLVVLTFDGIDQQYVTTLDKQTGKTVWRTDRTTDFKDLNAEGKPKADGDLRKAYHTPGIVEVDGRWQIVSVGSRAAFGYDLLTGTELWTFEHPNFNAAARPLFIPGSAIINTGSDGSHLVRLKLDASTRGNVAKTHFLWDRAKGNSKHTTSVIIDGRIITVADSGVVYAIDMATGGEIWTKRIGGTFTASPVVANGLIYTIDEKGISTVIRAGAEYQEVAQNTIADGARASPAIANGALYLRTFGHLYKIATSSRTASRTP